MRRSILLVEDEPILRVTLAHDLAEEGYEVATAADGDEGFSRIRERRFDAALLDLKLPGVDGLKLLKMFKGTNPQGAAIMMTALGRWPRSAPRPNQTNESGN